jgi:hypothetical protein
LLRIVVFAGTVGAGKSTQMKILRRELENRKLRVKTTFIKSGHLIVNIWETLLARLLTSNRHDVHPTTALIEERPLVLKGLFRLLVILDVFCVYLKFLITVYIPVRIGFIVLVEEYIPATIADYVYLAKAIGQQPIRLTFPSDLLLRLIGANTPVEIVFLDASDETLCFRWAKRKSFSEKKDYLHMQRTLIPLLLNSIMPNHVLYLDTTRKTIEETNSLVLHYLFGRAIEPSR